jgi:hypothetical protein
VALSLESGKSRPKARFSVKLPNGDYLQVAVWAGKSDPLAEVISVQLRHLSGEEWSTTGKLAVYRGKEGSYSQLPDRPVPSPASTSQSKPVSEQSASISEASSFKPYDFLDK